MSTIDTSDESVVESVLLGRSLEALPSLLDVSLADATVYESPDEVVVLGDELAVSVSPGSDPSLRRVDPTVIEQSRFHRTRDIAAGERTGD